MNYFYPALISALWAIWLLFWIVAGIGAKATRRTESAKSRLSHLIPLILGGAVLGLPNVLGADLEGRFLPLTYTGFWIGTALVGAGLAFSTVARLWLGRNWSSMVELKQDHELIRRGPYAWVRHPIYTGMLVALLGTAVAIGKWRALIGLALLVAALLRKITIEERFMVEQFGDRYARYRAEVAALVPYLF